MERHHSGSKRMKAAEKEQSRDKNDSEKKQTLQVPGLWLGSGQPPFLHYPSWDQQAGPAHQDACKRSAIIPQHNFLVEFCSIWGSSICSSVITGLGLILGTCPAQCDSDPLLCDAEHVHIFFSGFIASSIFHKTLGPSPGLSNTH